MQSRFFGKLAKYYLVVKTSFSNSGIGIYTVIHLKHYNAAILPQRNKTMNKFVCV